MIDFRKLPQGFRLGDYTIAEPLGRGAFASVYRAVDPTGKSVAIKVRLAGVPGHDRRFLREFESMRALRIPGVVRVGDAGLDGDLLWFTMDLVRGRRFDHVVGELPSVRERSRLAGRLAMQLLSTLADLHRAGIIHRDIKPSNVLVDDEDRVHVLDFGIVRFFGEGEGQHTTRTGEIVGTAAYMSPEQLAGLPIDERVDVWAAGVLLYEAVAGRRERPRSPVAWIPRTCLERPVPLAARFREVSRGFSHAVERMLSVDPDDRPSAADAASRFRADHAGRPSREWPEPPFVEPKDGLSQLTGCIGEPDHPSVQVLEGPAGSGKRRLAEQVQRHGLLHGVWTVHTTCRRDVVGHPVEQLLERVVRTGHDDAWMKTVFDADADPIRRWWPHLGLPGDTVGPGRPDRGEVAAAVARCLARLAARRPTLWIVHGLECVDPLTALVLRRVGTPAGGRLGLLVLHDPRWATDASASTRDVLARAGAAVHAMDRVDTDVANAIAAGLAPGAAPPRVPRCRPQHAVEIGLQTLAAWRDEPFSPPADRLWPLVVLDEGIPAPVLRKLAGASALADPAVVDDGDRVRLGGDLPRRAARARLADRAQAAAAVARAWSAQGKVPPADLARLRLLAGEDALAFRPAARAALEAEYLGRYADARRWLLLLDTLPAPAQLTDREAYTLARVRARVALRTEPTAPSEELVAACAKLARTPAQALEARLVAAEVQLRRGEAVPAVVAALRVAAAAAEAAPKVAVRALLVATQARAAAGRLDEVSGELVRAEDLLRTHPDPVLAVQTLSWRGELAVHREDLGLARDLSLEAHRTAARFGYVRGRAFAAARLGRVLRMAGLRRQAENHVRDALDAFAITGDVGLHADARLLLATLLAERGDAAAARHLLDQTIRRIRQLHLDRLLAGAMRTALLVATVRDDPHDATMALGALEGADHTDPETPSTLVRWWRIRGDLARALAVPPPERPGFGAVAWRVEIARAALVAGDDTAARTEAEAARERARVAGFRELDLYASLIVGALGGEDPDWERRVAAAAESLSVDVFLGALEMDARRKARLGDHAGARARWEALEVRARELGYRPGMTEASGWLER